MGGWLGCAAHTFYAVKKYPYIREYFVASFPYFNGSVSVNVCIRKSTEKRGPTSVPFKYGKLATKYPRTYTDIFTVHIKVMNPFTGDSMRIRLVDPSPHLTSLHFTSSRLVRAAVDLALLAAVFLSPSADFRFSPRDLRHG